MECPTLMLFCVMHHFNIPAFCRPCLQRREDGNILCSSSREKTQLSTCLMLFRLPFLFSPRRGGGGRDNPPTVISYPLPSSLLSEKNLPFSGMKMRKTRSDLRRKKGKSKRDRKAGIRKLRMSQFQICPCVTNKNLFLDSVLPVRTYYGYGTIPKVTVSQRQSFVLNGALFTR